MSKIKDHNPKQCSGGWQRMFGDKEMAKLFSACSGVLSSNGRELEKIIWEHIHNENKLTKEQLNLFFELNPKELYKCFQENFYIFNTYGGKFDKIFGNKPDYIYFDMVNKKIILVELKDGDNFDVTKAKAEFVKLKEYSENIVEIISTSFSVEFCLCCFNASSRSYILKNHGLKGFFNKQQILIGEEFCEMCNVDYNVIVEIRKLDQKENRDFVWKEMKRIQLKFNTLPYTP